MSALRLEQVLQRAMASGVLPPTASPPAQDVRPWPVVLLTGLGAWLAAIPLLGVVWLLFGDWISRSAGSYAIGVLVLVGAIAVLRSPQVPLFVEQLAVPALLVGGGSLAFGLFRDLPQQGAAALLAVVALGVAAVIAQPWLRVLLGVVAAGMAALACLPDQAWWSGRGDTTRFGVAWQASFALWLFAGWVQRQVLAGGARARAAAALESIGAGWLLAVLAGLAWWSGMSFLVGASLGGGLAGEIAREVGTGRSVASSAGPLQIVSVLLTLGAAFWLARAWPTLRRPWCAGVAATLLVLAWFMPALGAVWLALAACASSQRWRLAGAAALAAAWIVGSFYYALQWPLSSKAVVLIGVGVVLAALARLAPRAHAADADAAPRALPERFARSAQVGIAVSALAVLAVANVGIWQKEQLIAHGQPVYVELAPVDPRSLMQGDFMRLNFRVPEEVQTKLDSLLTASRPRLIVRLDERGIASVLRPDTGTPLEVGEMGVELTPKNGGWVFVTDAWYFREGEAQRWAQAKYGEFRVGADGRALLVGLVGANLQPL